MNIAIHIDLAGFVTLAAFCLIAFVLVRWSRKERKQAASYPSARKQKSNNQQSLF